MTKWSRCARLGQRSPSTITPIFVTPARILTPAARVRISACAVLAQRSISLLGRLPPVPALGGAGARMRPPARRRNRAPASGPRRIQVLFLGHDAEHHPSNKYAPMLAMALAKDG